MRTMGAAIDAAIEAHRSKYAESEVYLAEVSFSGMEDTYLVEVSATHFSQTLIYAVPIPSDKAVWLARR